MGIIYDTSFRKFKPAYQKLKSLPPNEHIRHSYKYDTSRPH